MADEAKITLTAQNNASAEIQKVNADLQKFAASADQTGGSVKRFGETITGIGAPTENWVHGIVAADAGAKSAIGSIDSLNQELKQIRATLNSVDPESSRFANLAKDSQVVQGRIDGLQKSIQGGAAATSSFAGIAEVAFGATLAVLGVQSIQAVIQKLGEFAQATVDAAAKLQQIQNMAEVVFGNTFPQAQQSMQALGSEMGRSGTLLLGFKSSLDLVAQGVDINARTADLMSTQLTQVAENLDKAFGGGQEKAVRAISLALEGSRRSLQNYAITLSSATLNQYLLSQGTKEHITDLDAESQAIVKWHYLMDRTTQIQALAVKNTGNLHDSTEKLSAAWYDFEAKLGAAALPAAIEGVRLLTGAVDILSKSIPVIESVWANVVRGFESSHPILTETARLMGLIGGKSVSASGANTTPFGPGNDAGAAEFARNKDWIDHLTLGSGKGGSGKGGSGANKMQRALEAAQRKMEETKQTLENLGETYKTKVEEIGNKLQQLDDTHQTTMQDLQTQMQGVEQSARNLKDSYADSMRSINESEASALEKSQANLNRLKEQLDKKNQEIDKAKAARGGTGSVSVQLQDDLADLQAKYDAALAGQQKAMGSVSGDVKSQVAKDQGVTDVEKQIAKDEEKRAKDAKAFSEKMAHYGDEMKAVLQKAAVENLSYEMTRQQLLTTEAHLTRFHDAWVSGMADMGRVTKDQTEHMRRYLDGVTKGPSEAQNKAAAKAAESSGAYQKAVAGAHDTHIAKIDETVGSLHTFEDQLTSVMTSVDKTTTGKMASMTAAVNAFMLSLNGLNSAAGGIAGGGTATSSSRYAPPPLDPYAVVANGGSPIGGQAGAMSAALRLKNAKQGMRDSQVQNAVKAEIRFGDVHIHNSNDEKVLANTIARQIDLLQVGSS